MKKHFKYVCSMSLQIMLLLCSIPCFASNYYIAQNATVENDGTSCANAYAYTWNWSGVSPGDTVYVCGTISHGLQIKASGSYGSPVTLKFCKDGEANCGTGNSGVMSAPYWTTGASGAGVYSSASYHDIVIDGNGVGIIEATDNGDTDKTYNVAGGKGVEIYSDNTDIKNLIVRNLYIKTYDVVDYTGTAAGIFAGECDNFTAQYNTVSYASNGITYRNTSNAPKVNVNLHHNTISKCNWGVQAVVGGSGSTIDPVNIFNNDVTLGDNWYVSDPGTAYHLNGSYCFSGDSIAYIVNLNYYNNYFHTSGNEHTWSCSGLIHADYGIQYVNVYNNLIVGDAYGSPSGGGYISISNAAQGAHSPPAGTIGVYNNTVIGNNKGGSGTGINAKGIDGTVVTLRNNIVTGSSIGVMTNDNNTITSDHNNFYDITTAASVTGVQAFMAWSTWVNYLKTFDESACEGHSFLTDPNLETDYTIKSGSYLIGAGSDLSTIFTTDKSGVFRGSSWDIGAYEYAPVGQCTGSFSGSLH